jgi:hypothetical protein
MPSPVRSTRSQRGEQPADIRTPDVSEDQADADGDQREPRDVEEDRRNPLAPRSFRRPLEQGRVQPREQQHQHDETEHRRYDAHRRCLARHLHRLNQQDEEGPPSGRMYVRSR